MIDTHISKSLASSVLCSRLILPYHPCFSSLGGHVSEWNAIFSAEGFPDFSPIPVYSLGGVSLMRSMQGDARAKLVHKPGR